MERAKGAKDVYIPCMADYAPEREVIARMRESGLGEALFPIDEAEALKGRAAGPGLRVAHDGGLGDGQPVARWDVKAIRGRVWDHDFAWSADCVRHHH